jgi:uncharacterized protein YndB with AHSA1/START domain
MAQPAVASPGFADRPSLTLTRRFRARPEKVWTAWTDPETLIGWFCTTKAKPGSMRAELDVRAGGRYRISFEMQSGEYSEVGGVYREVVPNEKLVFSWAWHSTKERESLVTVSIRPDGAGSLMVFTHEQFFDEAARDNHAKGWSELFGQLETILA